MEFCTNPLRSAADWYEAHFHDVSELPKKRTGIARAFVIYAVVMSNATLAVQLFVPRFAYVFLQSEQ